MAVQIISEDERLDVLISGTVFYYRRLPGIVNKRILKQCTKREVVDIGAYALAMLEYCILGWDKMIDLKGKNVPFDPKLIGFIPDQVTEELNELLGVAEAKRQVALKNS